MQKFSFFILSACVAASPLSALIDQAKAKKIQSELEAIQNAGGDRLGYAEAMLTYLSREKEHSGRRTRNRRELNPFDLFSGSLAIRESLQVSTISASGGGKATVDVSTLRGPEVKSHPFAQMLKGRKSEAFPLASHVPPDWFYAHFSSLTRALDLGDYLNQTGGAFYNRFSDAPVDSALKKRILAQLAILENKEARMFYDTVLSEVALVSSDFFFAMGTDVSLLFKLRQKAIFESTIKMYRAKFLKETPNAKEETVQIENGTAHYLSSPDNRLRSYFYQDGDLAIISNSPVALARLIRIAQKKEPALASLDEFKYMRSVYVADHEAGKPGVGSRQDVVGAANRENEDGFIYFSDAFIRRLVSPQVRIAEARRMEIAFRLAQAEKLILLHQHLYGKTAANFDELIRNTALDEKTATEMREVFAGIRANGFRAEHPEMGTLGFLKPNLETTLKKVTREEADGYTGFVANYSNFWREYFDPIGIRFRKKDSGIKLEICILPLIENSIYNHVTQLMGGPVPTHTITSVQGETLSLAMRLNVEHLRPFRLTPDDDQILGGFTGNLQIHGLDNYPTIDFDPGMLFAEFSRGRMRSEAYIGVLAWSLFHPLRVSLDMKGAAEAESLIATLAGLNHRESRHEMFTSYDYQYNGKKITVFVLDFFRTLTFRFHAWVDGKTIHVTSTRGYAEKYIDGNKNSQAQRGSLVTLYRPAQISNEKAAIVQSNAENVLRSCLSHLGTVKLAAVVFPGEDTAEAMQKRYGFRPVCPAGGNYTVKNGQAAHSMFGTQARSHADIKAVEALFAEFFNTEEFRLNFEFTPHGIMTSIETK